MKNYSIEIELIDKTGKNLKNNKQTCKINNQEVSKDKSGRFLLKQTFTNVSSKELYQIECDETIMSLNLIIDTKSEDTKIDSKKTKLSVYENGKKINIEKETILNNIAWSIDERNQVIMIKLICKQNNSIVKKEEKKSDESKAFPESEERINKILEKAKKQGIITYGELATELGDVTPNQIEEIFEKFEKMGNFR